MIRQSLIWRGSVAVFAWCLMCVPGFAEEISVPSWSKHFASNSPCSKVVSFPVKATPIGDGKWSLVDRPDCVFERADIGGPAEGATKMASNTDDLGLKLAISSSGGRRMQVRGTERVKATPAASVETETPR